MGWSAILHPPQKKTVSPYKPTQAKQCFVANRVDITSTIHRCQMNIIVRAGMEDWKHAIDKGYRKKIRIFKEKPNLITHWCNAC